MSRSTVCHRALWSGVWSWRLRAGRNVVFSTPPNVVVFSIKTTKIYKLKKKSTQSTQSTYFFFQHFDGLTHCLNPFNRLVSWSGGPAGQLVVHLVNSLISVLLLSCWVPPNTCVGLQNRKPLLF